MVTVSVWVTVTRSATAALVVTGTTESGTSALALVLVAGTGDAVLRTKGLVKDAVVAVDEKEGGTATRAVVVLMTSVVVVVGSSDASIAVAVPGSDEISSLTRADEVCDGDVVLTP